ncbi:hypothetical protein F5Y03DRAFT_404069 [Xylaria venustula]|nr:hypothetical protein F5Y03DRAFT_404069 [Xylaria venustula]
MGDSRTNNPTVDFRYVTGGPQGVFEQALANQGWRWIRTNTIDRTGEGASNGKPDRLGKHSHHGKSSHLVASGDLRVRRHCGDYGTYEISDRIGGKRQDLVQPNTPYSATSSRGCEFAEGHEKLSPRSAERFISRGTLRLVRENGATWEYPSDAELRTWLTSLKFNPDGKARPNLAKGENPILDASNAPGIPRDLLEALSEWFEKEWHRPSWWERIGWQGVALLLAVIYRLACYLWFFTRN